MKSYQEKQLILFLYHRVEDGLNFLQADFGVMEIAKVVMEVAVQYSLLRY